MIVVEKSVAGEWSPSATSSMYQFIKALRAELDDVRTILAGHIHGGVTAGADLSGTTQMLDGSGLSPTTWTTES